MLPASTLNVWTSPGNSLDSVTEVVGTETLSTYGGGREGVREEQLKQMEGEGKGTNFITE